MKTIDAQAYIQAKMVAELSRYPVGSVSKREVIFTISTCDEPAFAALDVKLTTLVYAEAKAAAILKRPTQFLAERERLTALAVQAIQSLYP